jgi:SAM-dependent methyltransferase
MNDLPEHVRKNRAKWDDLAEEYAAAGERGWVRDTPVWGIWHVPEAELHMLPDDLNGKDAIELGCGTAYVSSWLARRGARVVAIDNSPAQLATARRLQRQHGLDFELIHGNAESVAYPDASFDFAISEYGGLRRDAVILLAEASVVHTYFSLLHNQSVCQFLPRVEFDLRRSTSCTRSEQQAVARGPSPSL